MNTRELYYLVKPLIPRRLQIALRSKMVVKKRKRFASTWPILECTAEVPEEWRGWPENKRLAFVLTHDVDTARGQERCTQLAAVEKELGFRASFNFVPERYAVDPELRRQFTDDGFEVGVHGLNHDGKLYSSKSEFDKRAVRINSYILEWGAVGFRSPAMHHNLEWLKALNIEYDASTFDTDPFEPQSDGAGTIFPFWVDRDDGSGYVELPYTLGQDFTLFVLMKEKGIDIWKRKLDWIAEKGGMALVNTHPDYMNFNEGKLGLEDYPVRYYQELLEYVKDRYEGQYWHVLPMEMARFWKKNFATDSHGGTRTSKGFCS